MKTVILIHFGLIGYLLYTKNVKFPPKDHENTTWNICFTNYRNTKITAPKDSNNIITLVTFWKICLILKKELKD